jgi:hypothetical protein
MKMKLRSSQDELKDQPRQTRSSTMTEESNNNQEPPNRRSKRIKEKRQKQTAEQIHNMNDIAEKENYMKTMDYDENEAKAPIAMIMMQICERVSISTKIEYGQQHVVTYSLQQAIKKFGQNGWKAGFDKMKELHDRICFAPIDWKTLTPEEKKGALESLIFITQKRDGRLKGRHCANGKPQRQWMSREY